MENKKLYRNYGVTASIAEHKDGTATLKVCSIGSKSTEKKYSSKKSALNAWYRMCN